MHVKVTLGLRMHVFISLPTVYHVLSTLFGGERGKGGNVS